MIIYYKDQLPINLDNEDNFYIAEKKIIFHKINKIKEIDFNQWVFENKEECKNVYNNIKKYLCIQFNFEIDKKDIIDAN